MTSVLSCKICICEVTEFQRRRGNEQAQVFYMLKTHKVDSVVTSPLGVTAATHTPSTNLHSQRMLFFHPNKSSSQPPFF